MKKNLMYTTFICLFFLSCHLPQAEKVEPDYSNYNLFSDFKILRTYGLGTGVIDIKMKGFFLYALSSLHKVVVFDCSNPLSIKKIRTFTVNNAAHKMEIYNNLLVITAGPAGIQLVDISDPINPYQIKTIDTPVFAEKTAVKGDYIFVADNDGGIQVIDISNVKEARIVKNINYGGFYFGVFIEGNHLYAANGSLGVRILNISAPLNPVLEKTINKYGMVLEVIYRDDYLYISNENNNIMVVYTGAVPVELTGFDFDTILNIIKDNSDKNYFATCYRRFVPTVFEAVDFQDHILNRCLLASDLFFILSLYRFDKLLDQYLLNNELNLEEEKKLREVLGSIGSPYAETVVVRNYCTLKEMGMPEKNRLWNILVDWGRYSSKIEFSGSAEGLFIKADVLSAVDTKEGLCRFDISKPLAPQQLKKIKSRGQLKAFQMKENMAIAADDEYGVSIYDIEPENPILLSTIQFGAGITYLQKKNDRLFCIEKNKGLYSAKIKNDRTFELTQIKETRNLSDFCIRDKYLFLAMGRDGFSILSLTDYSTVVSVNPGLDVIGLFADERYLYLACGKDNLHVYDISDPFSPVPIQTVQTGGFSHQVVVKNNLVILADGSHGFQLIDISDMKHPVITKTYYTGGYGLNVRLYGNYIYLCDSVQGLYTLYVSGSSAVSVSLTASFPGLLDCSLFGNFLFAVQKDKGIKVLDLRDREHLKVMDTLSLPGVTGGIVSDIDRNCIYTACSYHGLTVIGQ